LAMAEALEMQFSGQLNDKQMQYAQAIRENGNRLMAMINSILYYTGLMAGKIKLQREPCMLAELCAIAVHAVRDHATRKRQTVAFSVEPAGLAIMSDAAGIIQTIQRLLNNAIKFTPVDGRIGLEVRKDGNEDIVRMVVWDTGVGIAPEQYETIFQPFVQGDGSLTRQFEGVGLGLAYVRRMVELLGGTIIVESALGEGSRFTVTLPVLNVTADQM
jgi:signal transduction histidine kinase